MQQTLALCPSTNLAQPITDTLCPRGCPGFCSQDLGKEAESPSKNGPGRESRSYNRQYPQCYSIGRSQQTADSMWERVGSSTGILGKADAQRVTSPDLPLVSLVLIAFHLKRWI